MLIFPGHFNTPDGPSDVILHARVSLLGSRFPERRITALLCHDDERIRKYRRTEGFADHWPDWYLDLCAYGLMPYVVDAGENTVSLATLRCCCPWPPRLFHHVEDRIEYGHYFYSFAKIAGAR